MWIWVLVDSVCQILLLYKERIKLSKKKWSSEIPLWFKHSLELGDIILPLSIKTLDCYFLAMNRNILLNYLTTYMPSNVTLSCNICVWHMFSFQYQNLAECGKTVVKMDNLSVYITKKDTGRLNISIGIFILSETNLHKYFFQSPWNQFTHKNRENHTAINQCSLFTCDHQQIVQ